MERNPYSPPVATVRDPHVAAPPRPLEVTRAIRIFWLVFVVGFITLLPSIRGEWWAPRDAEGLESIVMAVAIVAVVIFSTVYAVLVVLVGRRHNWARWALLAYVVLTSFIAALDLARSLSETPLAAVLDVLTTLAEVWAFYLLFFGPGAQWFRRTQAP